MHSAFRTEASLNSFGSAGGRLLRTQCVYYYYFYYYLLNDYDTLIGGMDIKSVQRLVRFTNKISAMNIYFSPLASQA